MEMNEAKFNSRQHQTNVHSSDNKSTSHFHEEEPENANSMGQIWQTVKPRRGKRSNIKQKASEEKILSTPAQQHMCFVSKQTNEPTNVEYNQQTPAEDGK